MYLFFASIVMVLPFIECDKSDDAIGPILEMYLDNITTYDFFDNSTLFNSTDFNSTDFVDVIVGSGEGISEGSGEIYIEQFRFVLPVRKRREADEARRLKRETKTSTDTTIIESAEIIDDGSGDLIEEVAIHQIEKRESKSKSSSESDNISIEAISRRKRSSNVDLERITFSNGTIPGNSSSPITQPQQISTCITDQICHTDADCNGGVCSTLDGKVLETCNCNACLNFWACYSDSDCGGLSRACNQSTNMCDCFGAFVLNGYWDTLDALARLCNVKKCSVSTSSKDCFGLPCNVGRCLCV